MNSVHFQRSTNLKRSRLGILIMIVLVASLAVVFVLTRPLGERSLELHTYFVDAQGLHEGAAVMLAGVRVGSVKTVQARPELKDHPAQVVLSLHTPYELNVPADVTVFLASAGLLGETFAEIDVRNTSGAPIKNGGILRSVANPNPSLQQIIERVADRRPSDIRDGAAKDSQSKIREDKKRTAPVK